MRIAVDHANAAGGVGGGPIRLLERDDEGKAERAIAAAEALVSRHGVVALLGGDVDSLVGPVSEVAERARVPCLAAASLDECLTTRGYRYFFRISTIRTSGAPSSTSAARRRREPQAEGRPIKPVRSPRAERG